MMAFSSERADQSERGSNTTYMVADFMPLYTLHLQVDRPVQTSLVATKASALGRYKDGVNGRVGATARIPNISRPRETEAEDVLLLPPTGYQCLACAPEHVGWAIDHRQFNRAQPICKLYGRMPQKVVVLGAGAIGSLVGARLHEAGADVRLIGRQDHVDAIRANGLLLKDQGKTRRVRLPATTTLADDADIILLTVKSQDVTRACREIAGVHSNATVLTMQNGVRSDGEAAGILGGDRIVGCVLNLSATYLEPGVVEQNTGALLQVGAPFPESADRVEAVLALLSPIMKTEHVPDIARARWTKLMANLNNAIMAITGLPIGKALRHRGLDRKSVV